MARTRTKAAPLAPREIVDRLSPLYGRPQWRPHGDPMAELILTVLSQNTSDTNSGRTFMRLLAHFPTWEALVAADPRDIEAAIRIGGLARIKAPRLKAVLEEVWRRRRSFDLSFLGDLPLEEAKAWLRSLPGVGPKTAACVLLFALGRPALPVDTHVHRVSQRLGLLPRRGGGAAAAHDTLEAMLTPEEVYPFHIAMVKHGRYLCRAQRPLCPQCPLRDRCPTAPLYMAAPPKRGSLDSSPS